MSNLAKRITKEQVTAALNYIIDHSINLNQSTRWNLKFKGQLFPPKEVVRWAARLANMPDWETMSISGGDNTNLPLKDLGFEIENKEGGIFEQLVNDYKTLLINTGLEQELYKWELVKEFEGMPNTEAQDFNTEIRNLKFSNLVYGVGIGVIRDLAKQRTEEYRECYIALFDENTDLQERIFNFSNHISLIYKNLYPQENHYHHHDERTISTLLTYHKPQYYGFYKDSFYQLLCGKLNIKPKGKGEKYTHYLTIVDDFIFDYLCPDLELINQVNSLKSADSYEDPNFRILAQDILYRTLEKQARNFKNIIGEVKQSLFDDFSAPPFIILDKSSFNKKASWIWVSDAERILSDHTAHYEIDYSEPKGFLNIYVHFESEKTDALFKNHLKNPLPAGLEWFVWQKGESIRFIEPVRITEENIVTTIIDRLTFIDDSIGKEIKKIKMDLINNLAETDRDERTKTPLNLILYGPPGTGKTYNTINKALEILDIDINGKSRKAIKEIFDIKLTEKRIAFCTFHQSIGYEDFVEGIKPLSPQVNDTFVKYETQNGIFKHICLNAQTPNLTEFNRAYHKMAEALSDEQFLQLKTPTNKEFAVSLNSQGNLNLHTGPERKKNGVLTKENIEAYLNIEEAPEDWKGYFKGVIEHLSIAYGYSRERASNATNNNYVLIIDEINRGNVSQIFGELITLIEDSKRIGNSESLKVTLPYSKSEFGVPNNLFLIGTMNTADRSVEALDTALRRRFSFEEMSPKPELLDPSYRFWHLLWEYEDVDWEDEKYQKKEKDLLDFQGATKELWEHRFEIWDRFKASGKDEKQVLVLPGYFNGLNLSRLLQVINDRVAYLLDSDHLIGHSFFINVFSWGELYNAFYQNIIPLLQEYFYNDYGKIELILGSDFIIKNDKPVIFAVANSDYDLGEKYRYTIKSFKNDIDSFKIAVNNVLPDNHQNE